MQLTAITHLGTHNELWTIFPQLFDLHRSDVSCLEKTTQARLTAIIQKETHSVLLATFNPLSNLQSVHWTTDLKYLEKSTQAQLTSTIHLGTHNVHLATFIQLLILEKKPWTSDLSFMEMNTRV